MDYDLQDEFNKKEPVPKTSKRKHGFLIILMIYFIVTISLFILLFPKIKTSLEESGFKSIFYGINSIKNNPKNQELSFVLLTNDGYKIKRFPSYYRTLHQAIESLIKGPDEEALKEGAITLLDPKTNLIGLSNSNGVYFIDFSSAFLNSGISLGISGLDLAKQQIFDTIKSQDSSMTDLIILIEGNPI